MRIVVPVVGVALTGVHKAELTDTVLGTLLDGEVHDSVTKYRRLSIAGLRCSGNIIEGMHKTPE